MKAGNQLRISIERHKRIGIAKLATFSELRCALLLHADECPQLIELKTLASKIAHLFVHQTRATIADANHQPHDRIAVDSGHPFDAAKAVALYQSRNNAASLVHVQRVHG
jgi:hypothetical protein